MELDPHPLTFRANEPLADVRERFEAMRVDLNWIYLHKSLFWDVVRGLERDSPRTSQLWLGHYLVSGGLLDETRHELLCG